MLIYVSHPYSGKEENKQLVENIVRSLTIADPENTYISPIHCFGWMYYDVSYDAGLDMCLKLLEKCDRLLVCGDWNNSVGCTKEIRHAIERGIDYQFADSALGE